MSDKKKICVEIWSTFVGRWGCVDGIGQAKIMNWDDNV